MPGVFIPKSPILLASVFISLLLAKDVSGFDRLSSTFASYKNDMSLMNITVQVIDGKYYNSPGRFGCIEFEIFILIVYIFYYSLNLPAPQKHGVFLVRCCRVERCFG